MAFKKLSEAELEKKGYRPGRGTRPYVRTRVEIVGVAVGGSKERGAGSPRAIPANSKCELFDHGSATGEITIAFDLDHGGSKDPIWIKATTARSNVDAAETPANPNLLMPDVPSDLKIP